MSATSKVFRAAIVAASAVALTIGPSAVAELGATAHAASATTTKTGATPHASTTLRAPGRPPTDRPKQRAGYVAPTTSPSTLSTSSTTFAAAATAATPASARTWGDTSATTSTLVLYDTTNTYGWLGELYAMAAGNLASHFGSVTAEPVVDYQAGQVGDYSATIYLGSTYNEPIPVSFLNDVLAATRPVLWAGDNVWQLAGASGSATATAFQAAYGWDAANSFFDDVDSVTQVLYNGRTLTRNANAGVVLAPHITSTTGQVTVLGQAQCGTTAAPTACAPIAQTPAGATKFPWAIKSSNLTYIGEIPLSYMSETDRYLAFSDQLFSFLSPNAPTVHQALVRLEDVSPGIDTPAELKADADYLSSVHVPFSVGVIPVYTDPNGYYGAPNTSNISQTGNATIAAFNDALRYMASKGGTIIEHGYTHQYSNVRNPYSAVSGDDFEFYRSQCSSTQTAPFNFDDSCVNADWIIQEGPLPGDSASFAQSRVSAGQQLFSKAGFPAPTIWETPHYSASAVDYTAFNSVYQTRYEREQFFGGQLSGITANASHVFGQFYPYLVHDVYGATVLPEDLGNYEPDAVNHTAARPPSVIIANAAAELSVRQGVASFFFHPYYDITNLQQIVAGIQGLGYTFVAPSALLPAPAAPAVTSISPTSGPSTGGTQVTITGSNLGGATSIHFGATAATIVSNLANRIVVNSPAGVTGAVDVTVTTPGGTSTVVPADVFTYLAGPRPAVSTISPTSGPVTGGTQVTITGSSLSGATSVHFGTVAATISSSSATKIVVLSPAGTAGTIDVTVTSAAGTSSLVTADRFTYTLIATTTKVTASSVSVGTPITFTATVTASNGATPTGTVRFTDGGSTIPGCDAVALAAGRATCTVTYGSRGSHTIAAIYGGSPPLAGSTGTLGIKVR